MDFFSAMALMKEGKKIKLKSWPKEKYIGIKEENVKMFGKHRKKYTAITSEELEVSPLLPFSVFLSSEWDIVD
jgi:hypothetical protein